MSGALFLLATGALVGSRFVQAAGPEALSALLGALREDPLDPEAWRVLGSGALDAARGAALGIAVLGTAAANLGLLLLARRRVAPEPDARAELPASAIEADGDSGAADASAGPAAAPVPATSAAALRAQLDIALAELERSRRALALHENELRAVAESRTRFVARMSHALRTPLNGVLGVTELLVASGLDEAQGDLAARLNGATQNLLGTVNALLDHGRLESGELRLQRSRFPLHEAIEDACACRAAEAHARGVELVCYIDEDVPRGADGDGTRLRQVIDALLANAIEHTDSGEVVVRVVREASASRAVGETDGAGASGGERSRYRCDVQDTGAGLSPERQLELWRAFRHAECAGPAEASQASETRDGERVDAGVLGLGLSVANELVRRMGGVIDVRSRLGEGSRFSFDFELGDVDQRTGSRPSPRTLRGARVLVVDDNETNRTILSHQMGNWGVEVACADGGAQALELMREAHGAERAFDLLVLDLHMPGMDGLELARRIAADGELASVPALMLTSSEIDLDAAALDAIGIERNLMKPARQAVLHDTLASMLRAPDARREAPRHEAVPADARTTDLPAAPSVGPGSACAAQAPDAGLLDASALAAIRELQHPDKPDLLNRVVGVWAVRAAELLGEMRDALAARDGDALLSATHGLKSSSGYLGATTVAARCTEVEAALARSGDVADAELVALVDALDADRAAAAAELELWLERAA